MSREVRRVPATWEHPRDKRGDHVHLLDGFEEDAAKWDRERAAWDAGTYHAAPENAWANEYLGSPFADWYGPRPDPADYMLVGCDPATRTHWQMYEATTEGTPISPVMETPEELARWLADTGASAFGDMTASCDAWLATIQQGSSLSFVDAGGEQISGVEFNRGK